MLESLRLVNFKSWKDTGDIQLAPITAFFGTNSSGKTSLLQALLLLKQTVASNNEFVTLDYGQLDALFVELGSFKEIIFNHDENLPLEFNLEWKLPKELSINLIQNDVSKNLKGNKLIFTAKIKKNNGDSAKVETLKYIIGNSEIGLKREKDSYKINTKPTITALNFNDLTENFDLYIYPVKFYGLGLQNGISFPSSYYHVQNNIFNPLSFQIESLFRKIYYLGPLRAHPRKNYGWTNDTQSQEVGNRGERTIETILTLDNQNRYAIEEENNHLLLSQTVAYWLKRLGLIEDFTIKNDSYGSSNYRVYIKISKESPEVLLTEVGFGISQIIPVITLCYSVPKGSIVIIEQPELHLHPKVQSELADVFIHAIKTRGIQIILESHSEHLLRRLQRRMAEFGLNDSSVDKEKINLYFCKSQDGASVIEKLVLDEFGNISNYPENFFGDDFGEIAAMAKARIARIQKSKQTENSI